MRRFTDMVTNAIFPTLILPGYSSHNKDWVDSVAEALIKKNLIPIPHYWSHWRTGKSYSFNNEYPVISKEVGNNEINLIAKSVGVMAALQLIPKFYNPVNKVILCGIASVVKEERKDLLKKVLDRIDVKNILCVQNDKDKYVPYNEALSFYRSVNKNIKVISKPRSDHDYPYFEDFLAFLGF